MGIKERRNMEKTEMKRKIMDASIEIIEQEGYEQLSIRKIASKIEYSPTTIYLYYKDKAEIISDMSHQLYLKVLDAETYALKESTMLSEPEQILLIMCIFIQELCSEPEMAKAIMLSNTNVIFANNSDGQRPSNTGIDMLDTLIARGIAKGVIRPSMEQNGWMIISALLGFVQSSVSNQMYLKDNFKQITEDFVKILMNGIKQ